MNDRSRMAAVVLAAGKGTRMKSERPKVLHELLGRPMLHRVLDVVMQVADGPVIVVTGHGCQEVAASVSGYACETVLQREQKGTGHAVMCARNVLSGFNGNVLILCGDTPLVTVDTLKHFIDNHCAGKRALSVLSTVLDRPAGYGRIVRDVSGVLRAIVEEKDADEWQRNITEVNTGIYAVSASVLFDLLDRIDSDNVQGEYYLTDIVGIAIHDGMMAEADPLAAPEESLGVNSMHELAEAEAVMLSRVREGLMSRGVTLHMPETIYIEPEATVAENVILYPHVVIKGNSVIGKGAVIGAFAYIEDVEVKEGTDVPPVTVLR